MSRRLSALEFDAITIEGGLLPAEWLANIAALKAPQQSTADYGVPRGLNLRDELGRYWRIAEAHWADFAAARVRAEDSQALARRFMVNLFRDVFAASDIEAHAEPILIGEHHYPIAASARDGRLPLIVAAAGQRLDERDRRYGDHNRQRSAFGLLQDYLNAADHALWGVVSNGLLLRLARDNASLTRPAWIEADLERIFTEERFADFSLLWLLMHASRFGDAHTLPQQCPLEVWREASKEQGTRARDQLRQGVEAALQALGQGFLADAANEPLRQALASGQLSAQSYFQQLLRLVYRLIFLLTVEERGLLHPHEAEPHAVQLYADGYSLRRLRERARRRRAWDRHADLWQGLKPVFVGLAHGESLLALPALGGLFATDQCPHLDHATLGNSALLQAVFKLGWMRSTGSLGRINWRDMGPEELGSVYESLLELVPQISADGHHFGFASADESRGNARKISGSYYTPDSLVQELLDSALEPVIRQRIHSSADPQAALLSITVCDPACGSGHFLLGAARRLATHLAQLRAQGTPSGEDFRHALRDVIAHCIHGVDRNPMALELARMSLWLEAMTPDMPLGFLDHHLQCGDALLGLADLNALEHGIPKDAYKALSGDDKDTCKQLAKRNAAELKELNRKRIAQSFGQRDLLGLRPGGVDQLRALEALPDATLEQIAAKQAAWQAFADASDDSPLHHAADMLLAAFLLPKTDTNADAMPTTGTVVLELMGEHTAPGHDRKRAVARDACLEARVLHWPLAFPLVHAAGGFACVLANPPWERIKLQEEEFFASRHRDVAEAKNKAERSQRIAWLAEGMLSTRLEPEVDHSDTQAQAEKRLYTEFLSARREAEAASVFAHVSGEDGGRYPLTGVGDVNTYALFAESIAGLVNEAGRAGFIVPTGIATDDSTKAFFGHISQSSRLVSMFGFWEIRRLFPGTDSRDPFCLLTLGKAPGAEFLFHARTIDELREPRRHFTLTPDEFRLINPNTLTCPVFRSERDAALIKKLYRATPVLIDEGCEGGNPWGISFMTMFHMSNDSHLFADTPGDDRLPLYEAKLLHQFDHRWATYTDDGNSREVTLAEKADPDFAITPRYWVAESEVHERLVAKGWDRQWLMGWRRNARATDDRTTIATVMPACAQGDSIFLWVPAPLITAAQSAAMLANLGSLVLDFVARQKVGGVNFSFYYFKQLPILSPNRYTDTDLAYIVPRVLELTYTAHDLTPWGRDLGFDGPPFLFNPGRRAVLRAELDAYYAKLYGLTHAELLYILDPAEAMEADYPSETFRVLKEKEIRLFGTYRTKDLVLEAWRALEAQQPVAIPAPKPARRNMPRPTYAVGITPTSAIEDWLAGLVCDVLVLTGPCDDTRLQQILTIQLPAATPHSDALTEWLAPVEAGRLAQILVWLRGLLGVPATALLSTQNPQALAEVIGDHRTESLAHALVEARRQRDAALSDVMAATSLATQQDDLQKSG